VLILEFGQLNVLGIDGPSIRHAQVGMGDDVFKEVTFPIRSGKQLKGIAQRLFLLTRHDTNDSAFSLSDLYASRSLSIRHERLDLGEQFAKNR